MVLLVIPLVAVAVAVACLRPASGISWFSLSQNIASRLRETPCFEKARFSCTRIAYFCWGSAEKNIGSQIFCQECLRNRDVFFALEFASDQTGPRNVPIFTKTLNPYAKRMFGDRKRRKRNTFQHCWSLWASTWGPY